MSKNKLKLNDDKPELLIVSSKNPQNKIQNKNIQIGSSTIAASTKFCTESRNLSWFYTVNGESYQKDMPISVLPNQESKQHKKTPLQLKF